MNGAGPAGMAVEGGHGVTDNPAMHAIPYRRMRWAAAAVCLAGLAGCGWAEFPAHPGDAPPVTAAPSEPAPRAYKVPTPPEAKRVSLPPYAVAALPPPPQPQSQARPQPQPQPQTVVVARGDTVYALSRRYGVTPRAIIDANGLKPPYELVVGQRLRLPGSPAATASPLPAEHVVLRGETLTSIARMYGVDVAALASANGLIAPYRLRVGQRLTLPGASARTKPAAQLAVVEDDAPAGEPVPVRAPPARAGARFSWPVQGKVVSEFGPKSSGLYNDGINIAATRGTPVHAAENGVVVYAGNELRGFGNLILVRHSGGFVTAYAHNEVLLVSRGDVVQKGQTIARVGSSGGVTNSQLHFQIRKDKQAVDPRKYLAQGST